ncbi:MAG: response regulator [Flavobacterium sp.]
MKALIADDQELVLLFVEKCLLDMNIEVIKSRNVSEAIARYDEFRPDIVITDINMPATDQDVLVNNHTFSEGIKSGLDLINHIKNIKKDTIPVLVLSGNLDDKIRTRSLEIGATHFIKKQIGYHDLTEKIGQIIAINTSLLRGNEAIYIADRTIGVVVPHAVVFDKLKLKTYIDFINSNANYHLCFLDNLQNKEYSCFLNTVKKQHRGRISVFKCKIKSSMSEGIRLAMLKMSRKSQYDFIGYLDKEQDVTLTQFNSMVEIMKNSRVKIVLGTNCKISSSKTNRASFTTRRDSFLLSIISRISGNKFGTYFNTPKVMMKDVIVTTFQNQFFSDITFDLEILFRIKNSYFYDRLDNLVGEKNF